MSFIPSAIADNMNNQDGMIITASDNGRMWLVMHNDSVVFTDVISPENYTIKPGQYTILKVFNQTYHNITVIRSGASILIDGHTPDQVYSGQHVDVFTIEATAVFWSLTLGSILTVIITIWRYRHRAHQIEVVL